MKSRKLTRIAAAAALATGITAGTSAVTAPQAAAWSWSPNVTLQGSSNCAFRASTWAWVEASNGERGWATAGNGYYRFNFYRVPTNGMSVRVNYGDSMFRCTATFGVQRPAVGTTATRNVYSMVPNG